MKKLLLLSMIVFNIGAMNTWRYNSIAGKQLQEQAPLLYLCAAFDKAVANHISQCGQCVAKQSCDQMNSALGAQLAPLQKELCTYMAILQDQLSQDDCRAAAILFGGIKKLAMDVRATIHEKYYPNDPFEREGALDSAEKEAIKKDLFPLLRSDAQEWLKVEFETLQDHMYVEKKKEND